MNQTVKIVIAVVALGAAVTITILFSGSGEDSQLVADETKTLWMCAGCSQTADLTIKEVETMTREAGPDAPPLNCPHCKEKKFYRAKRCEVCATVYFGAEVPGSTGVCPKCNPEAVPPPPPPENETIEVQEETHEPGEEPKVRVIKKPKAA